MRRILVVDDDRDALVSIANVLRAEFPDLDILVAANPANARKLADENHFDIVLASERLGEGLAHPFVLLRKPVDPEQLLALVRGPRE